MAVTRDGIPVRCWCWPGNASDQVVIKQVKDDMRDWTLSKIVWVAACNVEAPVGRGLSRSNVDPGASLSQSDMPALVSSTASTIPPNVSADAVRKSGGRCAS
nr:hypothetical protein [Sphaerisporangium perillae]